MFKNKDDVTKVRKMVEEVLLVGYMDYYESEMKEKHEKEVS